MAGLYTLGTAALGAVFVYEIFHRHELRTGLLFIALITGAAAYGLATLRSWARALAVFVVLAMAGLGAVALLSAFASHRGGKLIPVILLGASMAVGYILGTSIFDQHD